MESGTIWKFYGKISLEIVCGFYGENMLIKSPDNLRVNIGIKSP